MMLKLLLVAFALYAPQTAVGAQDTVSLIAGTWEAETPDGPQTIVVRADSTASFGEEIVRWKIVSDTIYIEIGDEWLGYNFELNGDRLTLSGGDLLDPVTLKRVGPPSRTRDISSGIGKDGSPGLSVRVT